jgi:WD40 repeat protein
MGNGAETEGRDRTLCRVFLCHNSADKPLIKEIADRLELDFGILHFLDAFDIPTGEAFRIWIERALKESTGCAIFLGSSGWGPTHRWEAEQALARRAVDAEFRLIPVALPGIREEDMKALGDGSFFRDLNWADLRNGLDDQDGLDKLYAALTGGPVPEGRGPARLTPYQVRRDAARWKKSLERDTSILYRGAQLEQAERLTKSLPELAAKSEVAPFLLASGRRQRTVWRRVAIAAVAVSLVVAGLGILAEVLREVAEQRRVLALSRELAIESQAEPAPDTSLLLAAQAYAEVNTPETAGNLLERLQAWPHLVKILHGDIGALTRVAWTSDASIEAGSSNGYLLRWSAQTFKPEGQPLRASKGSISSLALDNADGWIWAGYEDGRVIAWDTSGQRGAITGIPPGFNLEKIADVNALRLGPQIGAIAFSPDGELAAVGTAAGSGNGMVFLIDRKSKKVLGSAISVGVPRVNSLDFDPKSSILVAGTGFGSVVSIDTKSRVVVSLKGPPLSEVLAVRFAGDRLIAVGDTGEVAVWKRAGPSFGLDQSFKGTDFLTAGAIRPDGKAIALGDGRGKLHLYSVSAHNRTSSFQAHTGAVNGLAWDQQGNRLVSTGADGAADIWDFGQSSPFSSPRGRVEPNVIALRAANGSLFAGRSSVGSAGVWQWRGADWKLKADLLKATLAVLGQDRFKAAKPDAGAKDGFLPVPNREIEDIEIDEQGTNMIWSTGDGAVLESPLADGGSATTIYDNKAHGSESLAEISLSPRGHYAAIAYQDPHVLLFDLSKLPNQGPGAPKAINLPQPVRSLNFNPAETILATGFEDGSIALWSVPDGTQITTATKIHSEPAGNVTFSADGTHVFSNAVIGDGTETSVTALPVPSLQPAVPLVARASGDPPAMIRVDEHLFVTIDNDGKISFWDSDKLAALGAVTTSQLPVDAATFDAKNQQLVVADDDGWIQVLDVGGSKWQALACSIANRPLNQQEWSEFVGDGRYAPFCGPQPTTSLWKGFADLWR